MTLWEDHLLPLLTCKDEARLACTCKALRVVVRELFRGDLGWIDLRTLRAALTALPRARSVGLQDHREDRGHEEIEALLRWLCEGGGGRHLVEVTSAGESACDLVHTALQEGALPSLEDVYVNLIDDAACESLTGGFLRGIRDLHMTLDRSEESEISMCGLVRQLPALTKLDLTVEAYDDVDPRLDGRGTKVS
jgi:hypothetical protein